MVVNTSDRHSFIDLKSLKSNGNLCHFKMLWIPIQIEKFTGITNALLHM